MSLDEPNKDPYERLRNLRPTPTAYAAFGTASDLSNLVNKAQYIYQDQGMRQEFDSAGSHRRHCSSGVPELGGMTGTDAFYLS